VTEGSYDISKLRADGSHYAGVAFDLPYCLHLPYDHYAVRIEAGRRTVVVSVQLESHRRSGAGRGGFFVPPEKAEKFADRHGTYRYSSVVVYIPMRSSEPETHGDKDRMWKRVDARRDWLLDQSVCAVNRLVSIYRFCTQECHVRPLSGSDLWFDHNLMLVFIDYEPGSPTSKASINHVPLYYDGDIVPQILPVPQQVQDEIRELLVSPFQVPLWEELLLNAHDLLYVGSQRLSVIEGETAFEMALWDLVRHYYRSIAHADEEIDDIFAKLPHSFTQALHRQSVQDAFQGLGKQFCRRTIFYELWEEKVWRLRGALVHGRLTQTSPHQAQEAVDTIEDTLQYLVDRPRTKPWRHVAYPPIEL